MTTSTRLELRQSPPPTSGFDMAIAAAAVGAKRLLIGRPRASGEMGGTLLPKWLALPIFSSDPISSVAYATEAALTVLVATSLASRHLVLPISIAISVLLVIVVLSYRQGVEAYQSSGGSYVFARENLGTLPALAAAAALFIDYVLTVAVSIAAGVLAITSAAPELASHRLELSLGSLALLTVANLRGVRDAGLLFAMPTYGFLATLYLTVAIGITRCTVGSCPVAHVAHPLPAGAGALGIFVLLKAFSSGAVALTGVESISNGVTAFRKPQARNAARTLLIMAVIASSLFLSVSYLAVRVDARPSASQSVLSQIARAVFPAGSPGSIVYFLVQGFTLAILILAANTSFQGFPRLAALVAGDNYVPRQFRNLGDRLVYSNGILVLAGLSAALLAAFRANVNSLIHLYVIGVFTAFTLAQAGMVRHWHKTQERGWRRRALMNGIGAATTGVVTVVVVVTKFVDGAWMVIVAIPLMIGAFYAVHRHYSVISRRLSAKTQAVLARPQAKNRVVLYVERLDGATREALWYADRISAGSFRAVHVPSGGNGRAFAERFGRWAGCRAALEILPSHDEKPLDAMREYIWRLPQSENDFITVVIPEAFRRPSLVSAVLRRATFSLKLGLLREQGIAITDVPKLAAQGNAFDQPKRVTCLVLVSAVNAASVRALLYARSLGLDETRAVYLSLGNGDVTAIEDAWARLPTGIPLETVEAPYRDLGPPLLARVRAVTADPHATAVVVMPELVGRGANRLLHNKHALYIKRLLLFEPRVILTSVPYQLV